jgi:hypothetical protein
LFLYRLAALACRLVKTLAVHSVVQISCGNHHCVAMTSGGYEMHCV